MRAKVAFLGLVVNVGARAEVLTLDAYLQQVRTQNQTYQSARYGESGALKASRDADLIVFPTFNMSYTHLTDKRDTAQPTFQGTKTSVDEIDIYFQEQVPIGLSAKVGYSFQTAVISDAALLPEPAYILSSPSVSLSQSLWRNFWGSEIKAQQELAEATSLAQHHASAFQQQLVLADAEMVFWALSAAREVVRIQREFLDRSEILKKWAARRASLNLGDRSEYLQADAAFELHKLNLQSAQDDLRTAAVSFNLARNRRGDAVTEEIPRLDDAVLANARAPARQGHRRDVQAADEQRRATQANYQLSLERSTPDLKLTGTFSLNGRDPSTSSSVSESFGTDKPMYTIGVSFSTPLHFGALSESHDGYAEQKLSADFDYQKKLLDEETQWTQLNRQFLEAQQRLRLARTLSEAEKEKFDYERKRLNNGRTTTYQVLLFEQDYGNAQLNRVRSAMEVIRLTAQLKTFGGQK
jgi:outer membrane protein TolC